MNEDLQYLRLLSIFHYVVGGLLGLFGCIPIIHLIVGIAVVTGALNDGNGPPALFGWFFIVFATVFIVCAWALAIAVVVAGRRLAAHTAYTFCLVVAGIECMFMPFGTVLGVFTIVVLMRPSVKELFGVPTNSTQAPYAGSA